LNKSDEGNHLETFQALWQKLKAEKPDAVPVEPLWYVVSAKKGDGVDKLEEALFNVLPPGPMLFDEETLSDYPQKLAVADVKALRIDEAMNELALFVTGIYGKPLPKQNGAPIRLIVPWKYGLKSIKSIVEIEFTKGRPPTLWNQVGGNEYGWYSNVNPERDHPRWSQASEKVIPSMERRPSLMYNGYEKFVAELYNGKEF
jgi:hypothetical protein